MIQPYQKDDALIADIRKGAMIKSADSFRAWWLGQSGFLVQWCGKHLLFDPYLSDSLSVKYANTDKPHVRMSELVVCPSKLDMIDVVTSSHNHTDHLDAETLWKLFAVNNNLQMVIPEANRAFVNDRLRCPADWAIGSNDGESVEVADFKLIGVPAAHNELERDEQGRCKFMGFVACFGDFKVYHSGDTLWYDGMVELLKPFAVDIAFLPINGNKPERRVAGNLSAEEAAQLGKDMGAKLVIPHHYDMFEFNTEDPAIFAHFAQHYQTPHRILQIGEGVELTL